MLRGTCWIVPAACALIACSSSDSTIAGQSSSASGGAAASGPGSGGAASSSASGTSVASGAGGAGPVAPLHFIGRWDMSDAQHPSAAWPGSAIYAHFVGTGVTLTLHDAGTNFFEVAIDDGAPFVVATTGATDTYPLASNLADAEHAIWIEKRTESFLGIVQFLDLVSSSGTPLVDTSAPFSRGIEMVGDSITCGYGDEGMGPNCGFTPDTENEYSAWGAVAARSLKAAHTSIAYSGIGVYRDYGGSTVDQMPVKYERTFADDASSAWDFSWTPDVVVINLGTNDFATGDPGQSYVDAMKGFVQQVRGHYANAFIVLAAGTMLGGTELTSVESYLATVISAVGDAKISLLDLGTQDAASDGLGCDYHPTIATQQKMADKLAAHISTLTGW